MFADVAGVDEAKEELEEIVVSHGYLFFVMYLRVQSLKLLYDLNFFDFIKLLDCNLLIFADVLEMSM